MAYWLFKSEPGTWSWEQQLEAGRKGAEWDGVRNYQARNNMRAMSRGDLGFFYHSMREKSVVGIVKVVKEAHPDSTDDSGTWDCVDVAAVKPMKRAVSLDVIKLEPGLAGMALVKSPRLSVQPVSEDEWAIIKKLGKTR